MSEGGRLTILHRSAFGTVTDHRCGVEIDRRTVGPPAPTILFLQAGLADVRCEGRTFVVDSAQYVVLRTTADVTFRHHRCHPLRCYTSIVVHEATLSEVGHRLGIPSARIRDLLTCTVGLRDPAIQTTFQVLLHTAEEGESTTGSRIDELVVGLVQQITVAIRRRGARDDRHSLVNRVRLSLIRRLDEPHSLEELAREIGCSRFHLCRVFKEATGLTIGEYRHRLRLSEAVSELCGGAPDLSRLAHRLGYSSHSHFTRRFRRFYGFTPSSFRQRLATLPTSKQAQRA